MEKVSQELSGRHQRNSDGAWFEYAAVVEIVDGTPVARARVRHVDTGVHWDIATNISPAAPTIMPALVLATKMWITTAIDCRSGVDE